MAIRVIGIIKDHHNCEIGYGLYNESSKQFRYCNLANTYALLKQYGCRNMKYKNGKLECKENSTDRMPIYVPMGNGQFQLAPKSPNGLFVLSKMEDTNGEALGCYVINPQGMVSAISMKQAAYYYMQKLLINAYFSHWQLKGIKHNIPTVTLPDKERVNTPNATQKTSVSIKNMKNGKEQSKMNNSKLLRMQELVPLLKYAAYMYEQEDTEIMSNQEYDKLYDELKELEEETGIVLAGSVTQKVGFEVSSKLEKVTHPSRMLSLDKTKEVPKLISFIGDEKGTLSWKLDGLTVVATYENGQLVSAVTRGNGTVGENILNNYKTFTNVPLTVSEKNRLVIRGEAIIRYSVFDKINAKLPDDAKYKNPRNLCSGSVRQLDSSITASRGVEFYPFAVIEGFDSLTTKSAKLDALKPLGFTPVAYVHVTKDNIADVVKQFSEQIATYDIPSDGLVLSFDDIAYSKSLGTTSKFPKDGIAFKWRDELKETTLLDIEWSPSRTGALNPVAVFEPIELEGTTVSRASVHNVSIVEQLKLGIGSKITCFKANMIIPQVAENVEPQGIVTIPEQCPVCKGKTKIVQTKEAKVLYCTNPECVAKHIGLLVHYVSRDAMNIEGLSEATFEKFMSLGIIHDLHSIYELEQYKEQLIHLEGFGLKSFNNMIAAINKQRNVEMPNFLYALGISQVGRTASKDICKHFNYDFEAIMNATVTDLTAIDGIGDVIATELVTYMQNAKNRALVEKLLKEITFKAPQQVNTASSIAGLTFVVTGDVEHYKNRKELQAEIESLGGKVSSSVSSKTNYVINNDIHSTSSKNKKAKELGIPIISEQDFLKMIQ